MRRTRELLLLLVGILILVRCNLQNPRWLTDLSYGSQPLSIELEGSESESTSTSDSSSETDMNWYQKIIYNIFVFVDSFPTFLSILFIILIFIVSQICSLFDTLIASVLPGTPVNLASGFILGFGFGCVGSVVGCLSGALVGFILGRTLFRKWIQKKAESNDTLRGIDEAISSGNRTNLLIFLVRLSPLMPFPLCSYLFGLTKVTFLQHGIASFLGLLPGTVAYTYFGSLMKDIADVTKGTNNNTFSIVMLVVGVTSLILVSFIVGKIVANVIKEVRQKNNELKNGEFLENEHAVSGKEFIELEEIKLDMIREIESDDEIENEKDNVENADNADSNGEGGAVLTFNYESNQEEPLRL